MLIIGLILVAASGGNASIGFLWVEAYFGSNTLRVEEQIVFYYEPFLELPLPAVKFIMKYNGEDLLSFTFGAGGTSDEIPEEEIPETSYGSNFNTDSSENLPDSTISTLSNGNPHLRNGEVEYLDGEVYPDTGKQNGRFKFSVEYWDDDTWVDGGTNHVDVVVDGEGLNTPITFEMDKKTPYPEDTDTIIPFEYTLDAGALNLLVGDYSYYFQAEDNLGNSASTTPDLFKIIFDWDAYDWAFFWSTLMLGYLPITIFLLASLLPGTAQLVALAIGIIIPLVWWIYMFASLGLASGDFCSPFFAPEQFDPSGIALGMSIAMISIGLLLLICNKWGRPDKRKEKVVATCLGITSVILNQIFLPSEDHSLEIIEKVTKYTIENSVFYLYAGYGLDLIYGKWENRHLQKFRLTPTNKDKCKKVVYIYGIFLIFMGVMFFLIHQNFQNF